MDLATLMVLAAIAVPPGQPVANHAQPYHSGQPVIRTFERQAEDDARRASWDAYVQELGELWAKYRAAGSTARAWRVYQSEVLDARRRYIYADPNYAAIPTVFNL